jgi:hypothetical protein
MVPNNHNNANRNNEINNDINAHNNNKNNNRNNHSCNSSSSSSLLDLDSLQAVNIDDEELNEILNENIIIDNDNGNNNIINGNNLSFNNNTLISSHSFRMEDDEKHSSSSSSTFNREINNININDNSNSTITNSSNNIIINCYSNNSTNNNYCSTSRSNRRQRRLLVRGLDQDSDYEIISESNLNPSPSSLSSSSSGSNFINNNYVINNIHIRPQATLTLNYLWDKFCQHPIITFSYPLLNSTFYPSKTIGFVLQHRSINDYNIRINNNGNYNNPVKLNLFLSRILILDDRKVASLRFKLSTKQSSLFNHLSSFHRQYYNAINTCPLCQDDNSNDDTIHLLLHCTSLSSYRFSCFIKLNAIINHQLPEAIANITSASSNILDNDYAGMEPFLPTLQQYYQQLHQLLPNFNSSFDLADFNHYIFFLII